MEETVCSGCGRQMSLKDLESNSFREFEGKIYCPTCQLKISHPKRMRCPHCGKQTTAVLRDDVYRCGHCNTEIGGMQGSGYIQSARPSGSRDMGAGIGSFRKKDRTSQMLWVVLAILIAGTALLAALYVRAKLEAKSAAKPVVKEESTEPVKLTKDEEAFGLVENWIKSNPDKPERGVQLLAKTIEDIQDPVLKTKARIALNALQGETEQTTKRLSEEVEKLKKDLQASQAEITKLKTAPPEAPKPKPETKPAAQPGTGTVPVQKEDAETVAFKTAMADAARLASEKKFGLAMQSLTGFISQFPSTDNGKKASTERQRIRSDAYKELEKIAERAAVLANERDFAGARELYAQALAFGIPAIDQIIQQRLAEVRQAEGDKTAPPVVKPPVAVGDQIKLLRSGNDLERAAAAQKLGELNDKAAVPELIVALQDANLNVSSRAAQSLGKLGDASAVPALIAALGDQRQGVKFDAHAALKAITKQTFGMDERDKWVEWSRSAAQPPPPPPPPSKMAQFDSVVLERRYDPDLIRFARKDVVIAAGTKVSIEKAGKPICDVTIQQVTDEDALGTMDNLANGAVIQPGDIVNIKLPQ